MLHDSKAFDLDFSLVRGRVVLTNTKKKGEAKVWMRTADAGVQLTLPDPGDSVALQIYGRWPAGGRRRPDGTGAPREAGPRYRARSGI